MKQRYEMVVGNRKLGDDHSPFIIAEMSGNHNQPLDILTKDNLRAIRPGYGLPVKYYDGLLGKQVKKSVNKGTPFSWGLFIGDDNTNISLT